MRCSWSFSQLRSSRICIKARERLNKILSNHTGRDLHQIQLDTERDHFMSSDEAKEYGLIDDVLQQRQGLTEGAITTKKEED